MHRVFSESILLIIGIEPEGTEGPWPHHLELVGAEYLHVFNILLSCAPFQIFLPLTCVSDPTPLITIMGPIANRSIEGG